MRNFIRSFALAAILGAGFATHAAATIVTLDFDGLNGGTDGQHFEEIGDYYAGGFGSMGSGAGPDYGITIAGIAGFNHRAAPVWAYCGVEICPTNESVAGTPSGPNSMLIFGNGADRAGATVTVSGGFSGTVDFDAATTTHARFEIADPNVLGSLLTNISIDNFGVSTRGCPSGSGINCPFVHYSVSFAGVAQTIIFDTTGDGALNIDNLRFSDLTLPTGSGSGGDGGGAGGVPEPATWALMLTGFGMAGAVLRRRAAAGLRLGLRSAPSRGPASPECPALG